MQILRLSRADAMTDMCPGLKAGTYDRIRPTCERIRRFRALARDTPRTSRGHPHRFDRDAITLRVVAQRTPPMTAAVTNPDNTARATFPRG